MIVNLHETHDSFIFKDKTKLVSGDIILAGKSQELFTMLEASLVRQKNVFIYKNEVTKIDSAIITKKRVFVDKDNTIFLSKRARFFFKNESINSNDCESFEALEKKVLTLN